MWIVGWAKAWATHSIRARAPGSAVPTRNHGPLRKADAWARRAKVLPWPWDKEDPVASESLSATTHFELGPDADLPRAEAPDFPNRAFTVTVNIAEPGTDGVLVAHG